MPDDGTDAGTRTARADVIAASSPPPPDAAVKRYALDLVQTFNDEAENVQHQGPFHPVLIFGTSASGKSLALASLFIFTRGNNDAHINCQFMPFNYPSSCPYGPEYKNAALKLFDGGMVKPMIDGQAVVDATRERYPFFLPIQATFQESGTKRGDRQEKARFMFLESQGEWLHKDSNGYAFQPLKPEIAAVLEHFNKPLTAIFVAPTAGDEQLTGEEVIKSHEALAHAIKEFSRLRKPNHGDC